MWKVTDIAAQVNGKVSAMDTGLVFDATDCEFESRQCQRSREN